MKYVIVAALVSLLLLTSGAMAFKGAGGFEVGASPNGTANPNYPDANCPNCPAVFMGNHITQTNNQSATSADEGYSSQRAANWAVVVGDYNYLFQTNNQDAAVADSATTEENATNLALIIGSANEAHQLNDPAAGLDQMNEVIVLGFYNYVDQSNTAYANASNASVYQKQNNFGLIFGNNSTLLQSNYAEAYNYGMANASINQTQANAAYLYGFNNMVNQTNIDNATILENCTGSINQTDKNLAFAITACCSPVFMPECNNTTMNQTCPDIPSAPPAAVFPIDFPLDP